MTDGIALGKALLESSALILGVVNGLMLLRYYLRDRPRLTVRALHPDHYQWWFRLPPGEYQGQPTRKYGFLAYVQITNRGLRDVSFLSWGIKIKTKGGEKLSLHQISIPEPSGILGSSENVKVYRVLGQKTPLFDGSTVVKSGASVSGMAYYIADDYGDERWGPAITGDGNVQAELEIEDVFDKKASCKIMFSEISLERAEKMVPGIAGIG